jgi:predicted Zn-dependent protease with MMP-like domain
MGKAVIEVKSPVDQISQLEINHLPDQFIKMADKIVTEIQNKANNDSLRRSSPKSKRTKRKQKAQLEQVINK